MSSVIEDLAALPRFLTVKETCAFLGVSASTVKRFVKSGDLRQWTHRRIIRHFRPEGSFLFGADAFCKAAVEIAHGLSLIHISPRLPKRR